MFMAAMNNSIVNSVLPVIRDRLSAETATIEWVVTVYLLVTSGLLLGFGRLGDLRGSREVYLGGFGLFIGASMLCGLSPTAVSLILARVLQGVGAAMLFSCAPAILTHNYPAEQRGRVLGLQSMMTYIGLTTGPSLGGWIAGAFSWRAVFFATVPVGLAALWLGFRHIPRRAAKAVTGNELPAPAERFDLLGMLVFIFGLTALLLGLNRGSVWGWGSPGVLGLLAGAAVLLSVFIALELRNPHPMLDLSLFRRWAFSSAVVSAMLNYMALYAITFLMPFYFIQGRGLSAAVSGLLLTAQPAVMAVAAPLSGALSDRIGVRLPAALGMAVMAGGLVLLSTSGLQTPLGLVALFLAVAGLGTGMFSSPNNSAIMGAAPRSRQGIAAGVLATARNVGMVLGVGLAGAVLSTLTGSDGGEGIFSAIHTGFLLAAGLAALGSLLAALRPVR